MRPSNKQPDHRKTVPDKDINRQHRAAAVVALVLLLTAGAAYRVMDARLAGLSGTVPLPRGTLARMPMRIGNWIGRDIPLDERLIQATNTDDHLSRTYTRPHDGASVSLFIAYGVHFRDLMPHRPEVCYPGAGWTLEEKRLIDLRLTDGSILPAQIHHFFRGGLVSERSTVLNYYDVDGQYCPDVSLLRSKTWRPQGPIRYVAQIQISSPSAAIENPAAEAVSTFAADSAQVIRAFLAEVVTQADRVTEHGISDSRSRG